MQAKHTSIGAITAIALIWLSPVSQATPLSLAAGGLKVDAAASSGAEKAAYRVCWLKDGIYPKCRWYPDPPDYYYPRYGYYDYGPYRRCWLKHGIYPKCR